MLSKATNGNRQLQPSKPYETDLVRFGRLKMKIDKHSPRKDTNSPAPTMCTSAITAITAITTITAITANSPELFLSLKIFNGFVTGPRNHTRPFSSCQNHTRVASLKIFNGSIKSSSIFIRSPGDHTRPF